MKAEPRLEEKRDNEITQSENAVVLKNVDAFYAHFMALKAVNLTIEANKVTSLIGPSGCGKSTVLRLMNRMNDYIDGFFMRGNVEVEGFDVYANEIPTEELRKRVGMVFQKPNPFPKTIYENVAYGLRIQGVKDKNYIEEHVVGALKKVALWEEVKDDLKKSALALSGGQQQRLCIARTLAIEPHIILMDEPTSALDPIATSKIEDLIYDLKQQYTIVLVTHNMQQASRISDYTAFLYLGEMIEMGKTKDIFTKPKQDRTENYITGRFG